MSSVTWSAADFFEPITGGARCTLCPFACELHEGQTGRCQVRRWQDGRPETLTRSAAVRHWTPIERKPFYHFRPGSLALTLAAPGCNWTCHYCLNHRLSQYGRESASPLPATLESVDAASVAAEAARAGAVLALSYTEPTLAAELTLELAAAGAPLGVPVVWKSNGFVTRTALQRLAPCLAAVNVDLKTADESSHRALTGASLAPVLATIDYLRDHGVWVEISTPLIPAAQRSPGDFAPLARRVRSFGPDVPWHLLRFTPEFRLRDLPPTSCDDMTHAVEAGREAGLHYVYVEKALGPDGRATRCPACQTLVVTRETAAPSCQLVAGQCSVCGLPIPGRWN